MTTETGPDMCEHGTILKFGPCVFCERDNLQQAVRDAITFAEGVLEVCEFLDNSDHHYTKHTKAHIAKWEKLLSTD